MPDFTIKAHDLLPSIEATLRGPANKTVDLTDATVRFIMKSSTDVVKVNAAPVIVDASTGVVRYDWAVGDTDTAGDYRAEWQVNFANGKPQTFPTDSYHDIAVAQDLDGA